MKKKVLAATVLAGTLLCACSSSSGETGNAGTTAVETSKTETTAEAEETSAKAKEKVLTGKGQGFGGVITAQVTIADGVITDVTLEGSDETPGIGGAGP